MLNKKIIQTTLCVLFITLFSISASMAQKNEIRPYDVPKHSLSVNAGWSAIGGLFKLLKHGDITDNTGEVRDSYATPAMQVTYDYSTGKKFSIGGGISVQKMGLDVANFEYTEDDVTKYADVVGDLTRLNIGIRPLFHYGKNRRKVDMYSGFRVGVTNWLGSISTDGDDGIVEFNNYNILRMGMVPAFQVIPFGMKWYIGERVGLNFETGIGTPHTLSGGISIRL